MKIEAKNLEQALLLAAAEFECSVVEIEYELIERGRAGFMGLFNKPTIIEARAKKKKFDKNRSKNRHDYEPKARGENAEFAPRNYKNKDFAKRYEKPKFDNDFAAGAKSYDKPKFDDDFNAKVKSAEKSYEIKASENDKGYKISASAETKLVSQASVSPSAPKPNARNDKNEKPVFNKNGVPKLQENELYKAFSNQTPREFANQAPREPYEPRREFESSNSAPREFAHQTPNESHKEFVSQNSAQNEPSKTYASSNSAQSEPNADINSVDLSKSKHIVRDDAIFNSFHKESGVNPKIYIDEIRIQLDKLLKAGEFDIRIMELSVYDKSSIYIRLDGNDAALLIGKEAYRYKALSYLLHNWINAKYNLLIRLEIADFLRNQAQGMDFYLKTIIERVESTGRAQTKPLDGVLVKIALEKLRERFPNKYVGIRQNGEQKFVIVNDFLKKDE